LLDDIGLREITAAADRFAADLRARMNADDALDPADLFAHVYAQPTPALRAQQALLQHEMQDDGR
jgi:2-oxoisovalerate dehydrogenase E1 component alpha subunit